jgi:hypothetical protein
MAIINDGHPTLIRFALDSSVQFKEKEVTPPGLDGGGENDTTTMHNVTWRTRQPKSLVTLTECTFLAAYDPIVYDEILAMLNQNQLITVEFPDGSELRFYGWINEFTPNRNVEGEQPTAEVTIIPSNQDSGGVETPPDYVAP